MKQRLELPQLQELTEDQKQILRDWWEPKDGDWYIYQERYKHIVLGSYYNGIEIVHYTPGNDGFEDPFRNKHHKERCLPILSVGQMIEMLMSDSSIFNFHMYEDINGYSWNVKGTFKRKDDRFYEFVRHELCDALWEALKDSLRPI